MSKTSQWVVTFNHETKTFEIDWGNFGEPFVGSIYDEEKDLRYYPDDELDEAEVVESAGWDLEQALNGLNLILEDREEE